MELMSCIGENGNSAIMKTGLRNFAIAQMGFAYLPFSNDAPYSSTISNYKVFDFSDIKFVNEMDYTISFHPITPCRDV